ncbi:peptidoglycan editing factor PgeF [Clostridioides difficile]|uniref:peptidoglycan editing factor PgeF n=1 Tax=Clostridioides difficile TaxID=1496 RepID=UPI002411B6E6|nr:peptidoglycan editing factor PgeF [Clostridioides difficile]HBF0843795.1 peptidoglycan editing factor PgeF [Clostridioides difficile]HBF0845344.1 peptidoglycan editing factor PgeF [Clostridioides difficile]
MMKDYINIKNVQDIKEYVNLSGNCKELDEKLNSVNLVITCKNIDAKNREDMLKVCKECDLTFENLTSNSQIHSDIVNIVNKDTIGKRRDGDALITNLEKVPLLLFTADCVPISVIDAKNKAIGLAHAGWRGTFSNIGHKTIKLMSECYKTVPEDLVCIIGPSIGPCCYEVSEDLVEKFNTILTNNDEKFYIIKEGSYYLDLWKINEYMLRCSGVKKENIINLNLCTSCRADKFHSYRKHNKASERIGTVLQIK